MGQAPPAARRARAGRMASPSASPLSMSVAGSSEPRSKELARLQYLSLVSKVAAELENHLGIGDKTLAEFVIEMAKDAGAADGFARALQDAGAGVALSPELSRRIYNLVSVMSAAPSSSGGGGPRGGTNGSGLAGPVERKGLSVADSRERAKEMDRELIEEGKKRTGPAIVGEAASRHIQSHLRGAASAAHDDGRRSAGSSFPGRERDRSPPGAERRYHRGRDDGDGSGAQRTIEQYSVYRGRVTNVMDFGCFVEILGARPPPSAGAGRGGPRGGGGSCEGLVHVSQLASRRVSSELVAEWRSRSTSSLIEESFSM